MHVLAIISLNRCGAERAGCPSVYPQCVPRQKQRRPPKKRGGRYRGGDKTDGAGRNGEPPQRRQQRQKQRRSATNFDRDFPGANLASPLEFASDGTRAGRQACSVQLGHADLPKRQICPASARILRWAHPYDPTLAYAISIEDIPTHEDAGDRSSGAHRTGNRPICHFSRRPHERVFECGE